ncbi:hypothetical protein ATI61_11548 [Archangium gephyra]|uniref:Lipoprotein n=1 Tax=Archangium gephyra TaxID=48 RepID=A0ABX9JPU4_9BACT|nr:hypothetical protein [Archangium gephyra]REG24011.1 hypothetical protein ATI61_11548 [Archangium gephyra]
MHRSALLALALVGCAAPRSELRQATATVATPAPSFPQPGFIPAGAGASHGGLVPPQSRGVDRSPNRRDVPPSRTPGLWGADPVKAFKAEDPPRDDEDPEEGPRGDGPTASNECRHEMHDAAQTAKVAARFETLSTGQQECVTARLLLHCSNQELKLFRLFHEYVAHFARWVYNDIPAINVRAARYARDACKDVFLSLDALAVYRMTAEVFENTTTLPRIK